MANGQEMWVARCPKCGHSNLTLAPAKGFTKHILAQVEVFCSNCSWIDKLANVIKQVYVRM